MGLIGRIASVFVSGPAIQRLDEIDFRVDLKDGAVLLPIITVKYLDDSHDTRQLIAQKLETYKGYLESDKHSTTARSIVEFKCTKPPDPKICEYIESFTKEFESLNSELTWKT